MKKRAAAKKSPDLESVISFLAKGTTIASSVPAVGPICPLGRFVETTITLTGGIAAEQAEALESLVENGVFLHVFIDTFGLVPKKLRKKKRPEARVRKVAKRRRRR